MLRPTAALLVLGALAGCATGGLEPDTLGSGDSTQDTATPASADVDAGVVATTPTPHPPPPQAPTQDAGAGPAATDAASGASDAASVDSGSGIVEVTLTPSNCLTVTCPASAPYPVGCAVTMSGDNNNGCVASTPTASAVYFKSGKHCDENSVSGKLLCSAQAGTGLNAANCTMNKSDKHYETDKSKCPD